jgi:predicted enzyme related to lactoylglutathione lyase
MSSTRYVALAVTLLPLAMGQTVSNAHFHHLHLNATDPAADIEFYTTKFDAEKAKFAGLSDAVWAQKSWILFTKVTTPPKSEITSTIWHFGWGAEDMKATYEKQVASGTKFETPLTDISDIGGNPNAKPGSFYYAYVLGPDGALIELNTAAFHRFGHLHLLSENPVAAAEWYEKQFGVTARKNPVKRMYRDTQIGPSASFNMDNVNVIIFPVEYAHPVLKDRETFESTAGHVVDHIGVSVDNLDDAMTKLKAAGVKVLAEARSVAGGKIKYAFVEGPDKMKIEVIEGQATRE